MYVFVIFLSRKSSIVHSLHILLQDRTSNNVSMDFTLIRNKNRKHVRVVGSKSKSFVYNNTVFPYLDIFQ